MVDEIQSKQVLALFREGCTVEEISEQLGLEVPLVKLVAARHEAGNAADRDIDDDELRLLRKHAFNLAMGASDDATQARMTMFLIERDKPSKKAQESSPLVMINQAIMAANANFAELAKQMGSQAKVIES